MRKIRRKYTTPLRPWDDERIESERKLKMKYGLRRKREVWKAVSVLRKFRGRAREIAAKQGLQGRGDSNHEAQQARHTGQGCEAEQRADPDGRGHPEEEMQTIVFEKGLANTAKQARQLINHGHIAIDGRKFIFPNALVTREMEPKISYYGGFS